MADVQKEKGFTQVANQIFEEIVTRKLNASQLDIIMVVWRYTYGFHRKDHELSVSFFVNSTGLSKKNVKKTLNDLLEAHVLIKTQNHSFHQTRKLAFNKNYDEWLIERRNIEGTNSTPGVEMVPSRGGELVTSRGVQLVPQERKSKENYKEKIYMDFQIHGDSFLKIYNDRFEEKFNKQHMRVTPEQESTIYDHLEKMKSKVDIEEFQSIVDLHFNSLPKNNNGNFLYFISVFLRHLGEIKKEKETIWD
ncbi:replication protein [Paraliobacillus sediminis]|uniref:replication protein n=1 Tax=Paraliobacillus sediminis TaxID=1885916 RepID=UPI000E3E1ACB|nr:replication protein [Paraliobacillus sediminis]